MKKQILMIITSLLIISSSTFAQKKDHPLIGHLEGAELWMQNINKIHEYLVITGPMENDSLVSSVKVVGKVTMTSYEYKGDNSAFGIIHNYTDFLKNNRFEILLSCKGGECGGNIAKYYNGINRMEPFDQNNAIAWQSRYFKNFLSAKKQISGKTVYVCIYIAQGWWKFPIYRIDVIEESEQTNMIVNDNTEAMSDIETVENLPKNKNETNDVEPNNTKTNKKSNSFTFQAGISQYNFYDPSLYGQNTVYQSNGVYSGVMSGFKDLSGPYFKVAYLFNENVGIVADVAFHHGEAGSYIENGTSSTTYESSAEQYFQRIGVMGRFIGEKYPVKLSFSSGLGRGSLKTYYMIKTNTEELHYEGFGDFPMVFFQTELLIPLFKGLFFFSEYEYTVGWSEDFYMDHNNGSEYHSIEYKSPGFGGNNFRIGLGYEFGGK